MTRQARKHRRRNSSTATKNILLVSGISLAVILTGILIVYFVMRNAVNKVANNVIGSNVFVEDIKVSGMTVDEAKSALEVLDERYKSNKIKLAIRDTEKEVTFEELGFKAQNVDELLEKAVALGKEGSVFERYRKMKEMEEEKNVYDVVYSIDATLLDDIITENFSDMEGAAVNATIKRENGQFIVTESRAGIKVDVEASARLIEEYFEGDWETAGVKKIELVTSIDEPDVSKEELSQIQDVLGTCVTAFVHTNNRGKNVIHATSRINGTLLMPGEQMSASDTMGSRNEENGYLTAGSYLNGETVETYGGGVCQVSSTLYGAALYAELEIVERHPHSMTVSYMLPSMDAAISEGSKDLKIKNNSQYPIYIEGYTVGGQLTFTIYGKETRSANRTITFEDESVVTKDPGYNFVATIHPLGHMGKTASKHEAMKSKLWKIVKENGVEVSRTQINSSSYGASKGTYQVGIETDNAAAKQLVINAIGTQDEAKIRAAIAQAQALIASSKAPSTETTTPEVEEPTTPPTTENGGN